MRKSFFLITLIGFTCLLFAQDRNFKLVKAPTEKPTDEKRKAIVIGMSDYGAGRSLNNTLNDADDMATVLTRLGFQVTLLKNNDLRSLKDNLSDWYNTIERNDMAIFYFAGHGMEVNRRNYLIPINAELKKEADIPYEAISVDQVLDNMDNQQVRFKLLILDACRDNPFTRGWSRSNSDKGLAQMSAPKGTLIAFAAQPGATAQDGGTHNLRNGVFTHFLKQEIVKEGFTLDNILNSVAGDVSKLTNDQQLPYKTGILTEEFYFIPKKTNAVTASTPAPAPEVVKRYYYYIDQNGNESQNRFDDRKTAENEMRSKNLYGKIYNNAGEAFIVDKPTEPAKVADRPAEPAKAVEKPAEQPPTPVSGSFADYTEITNSLNIAMVAVQGGTFTMGCTSEQGSDCFDDEKPAHQVTVGDFYIGKYEVTQAQWKAVMGSNPSNFKGDNLPVEKVCWNDVQNFIQKLNAQTGKQYRLPTEAEWEFAARGGKNSRGYKYSGSNTLGNVAWYKDNSDKNTHAVGTKSANELGIYDMSGNVWEWCNDWKGSYSNNAQTNPQCPTSGSRRVIRGGSWDSIARRARVSYRYSSTPDNRNSAIGFRLACSIK